MITHMEIDNFKSLNAFEIDLAPFTVLIGDNSVGKTTVLQAIGFLARGCTSSFDKFLEEHDLSVYDIDSKLNAKRKIAFSTVLQLDGKELIWDIVVAQSKDHFFLSRERIRLCRPGFSARKRSDPDRQEETKLVLSYSYGIGSKKRSFRLNARTDEKEHVMGGIFDSSLIKFIDPDKQAGDYPELAAIKRFFSNMEALDLLSPYSMKKSSKGQSDTIGLSGEKLGAFIKGLPQPQREALVSDIRKFVPKVAALVPKTKQYGWVHLESEEKIGNRTIRMSASNISDGLLRIIAMCSTRFLGKSGGAILLDELEDGINNEHLEQLVSTLKEIRRDGGIQVIATTHNTVLLDYVLDEPRPGGDADGPWDESVVFLYDDGTGSICAKDIFSAAAVRKQLDFMYPGEIILNTTNSEMIGLLKKEDKK